HNHWVSSTDADAFVCSEFFEPKVGERIGGIGDSPALALHSFHHPRTGEYAQSMALYDWFLAYYVAGLRHAGSPYALFTLGSILRFSLDAYSKVRGFPKKEAGEDFYFVSKLAKIGSVHQGASRIELAPRPSPRVPFGTG